MATRSTREERAVAAEQRAIRARLDYESTRRDEVAVLWRCVRDIDKLDLSGGLPPATAAALDAVRAACSAALVDLGLPCPEVRS